MRSLPPMGPVILVLGLVSAVALTSCGTPGPRPIATESSPPSASAAAPDVAGLLVAAGGVLQVTDRRGALVAVPGPPGRVVDVSAGGGRILAVDPDGGAWISTEGGGAAAWQPVDTPDAGDDATLAAIAPDGHAIAFALGTPQGRLLRLQVRPLDGSGVVTVARDRGLDGPPVWLGPSTVAIRSIGRGGKAAFTLIDPERGTGEEAAASGVALAASADGRRIAVDDQASGESFVGARADWQSTGLDGLARIAGREGAGIERLALSPSGERLAVVYRSESGAAVDILTEVDGPWRSAASFEIQGDGGVAIAWRE